MASKWKDIGEGLVGAVVIGIALLTPFLRSRRVKWGATDAEIQRTLPGDDLVPNPKWQYTNAITIEAPVTDVWPWLVQIGQGRGGWYTYEWLENLVGCGIHNANQIIQEFQHLEVGDSVRLAAEMPGYPVAIIESGRAIVLYTDSPSTLIRVPDLHLFLPERSRVIIMPVPGGSSSMRPGTAGHVSFLGFGVTITQE
jgi:hypothetical protein